MNSANHAPLRIDVRLQAGEMEIEWRDLGTCRIKLYDLRRSCPCAQCEEVREQYMEEAGLHMVTDKEIASTAEVRGVTPVGRYAIRILWADAHDTGIYSYDYLRRLCEELGDGRSGN